MNQALVEPDLSLDESVTSLNYKWVKDSWVSQNHPTINETADRSTFVRGNLDTVRKTQVRQLARILDEYNSPEPRPHTPNLIEAQHDKSLLVPQAASSPKSRASHFDTSQNISTIATSMKEKLASPSTSTNETPSWQKHTLHSSRGNTASPRLAYNSRDKYVEIIGNDAKSFSQAKQNTSNNYKPTHVSNIEDSHWKPGYKHNSSHHLDVTPSPVRTQQQFFTAKQSSPVLSPLTVESLRIASPRLQHSPSVRNSNGGFGPRETAQEISLESLKHDQPPDGSMSLDATSRHLSYDITQQSEAIDMDHFTNGATRGDWTEDQSDLNSELSKVDSQATSLQHAIASALNSGTAELIRQREAQDQPISLEDAIVARYRQSRNDRSHATATGPNALQEDVTVDYGTPVKSSMSLNANVVVRPEPVKHDSPLQEAASDHKITQEKIATAQTPQAFSQQGLNGASASVEMHNSTVQEASVVELINAFDKVTSECSRRGRQIEDMMGEMEAQSRDTRIAQQEAAFGEQRASLLEEQLRLQKLELVSLTELVLSQQRRVNEAVPRTHASEKIMGDNLENISARDMTPGPRLESGSLCQNNDTHGSERSQESFQDKIHRWGAGTTFEAQKIYDPVEQAKRMLRNPPAVLQRADTRPMSSEETHQNIRTYATQQARSMSRTFSRPQTPERVEIIRQPVTMEKENYGSTKSLTLALECAQTEIRRLRALNKNLEAKETATYNHDASIKPISAESMPDAKFQHLRPEEKMYARLNLDTIDTLNPTTVSNILKNILIQLDLPFDNLSITISDLASKMHTMDDQHDLLVHEVMKLRSFAENVHATLYLGDHMEGTISSRKCLKDMQARIDKMSMVIGRRKSGRTGDRE